MLKDHTEQEIRHAIINSTNYTETIRKLYPHPSGSLNRKLREFIRNHNIDISHFITHTIKKIPTCEYLNNNHCINGPTLRKRLIKEKILKNKCYKCNRTKWLGQNIPLELHHIDGDRFNNNLSNIIVLCPNCHTISTDYDDRKVKKSKCRICKKRFFGRNRFCSKQCYMQSRANRPPYKKINVPPLDDMIKRKNNIGAIAYAKELRISVATLYNYIRDAIYLK